MIARLYAGEIWAQFCNENETTCLLHWSKFNVANKQPCSINTDAVRFFKNLIVISTLSIIWILNSMLNIRMVERKFLHYWKTLIFLEIFHFKLKYISKVLPYKKIHWILLNQCRKIFTFGYSNSLLVTLEFTDYVKLIKASRTWSVIQLVQHILSNFITLNVVFL